MKTGALWIFEMTVWVENIQNCFVSMNISTQFAMEQAMNGCASKADLKFLKRLKCSLDIRTVILNFRKVIYVTTIKSDSFEII